MVLAPSNRWAKYLGTAGTVGCSKCRETRGKVFQALTGKVCLLFSGGLDSTYAAIKLREQGLNVELYTAEWSYESNPDGTDEASSAGEIAEALGLPLHFLGRWETADTSTGITMRVPMLMSAVLTHRDIAHVGVLAWGGHPSTYELDARWLAYGEAAAAVARPGTQIVAPCDGVSRKDMWEALPEDVRPLIFSCYETQPDGTRCGVCDKCTEDMKFTTIS